MIQLLSIRKSLYVDNICTCSIQCSNCNDEFHNRICTQYIRPHSSDEKIGK